MANRTDEQKDAATAAQHELWRRERNRELVKQGKPKLPAMANLGRSDLEAIVAS